MYLVRYRGRALKPARGRQWSWVLVLIVTAGGATVCSSPDRDLAPDEFLRTELGLTIDDRVHRVGLFADPGERAEPVAVSVETGDYVEFVTLDWRVHEILFEIDSLGAEHRAFLEHTDQVSSPPLVQIESRFVVSFDGAPPGPYLYRMEGNGPPGWGVVVVSERGSH